MKDMRYWAYMIECNAWWLMQDNGLYSTRLYGPFKAEDAARAGSIHGVPFAGKNLPQPAPERA